MEQNTQNSTNITNGNIRISDDVLATITGVSATEIDGVAALAKTFTGDLKGLISNKRETKGIKVEISSDEKISVDISLIVYYGRKIPDIAADVQENVYKNLTSMTGYTVDKINVTVAGIIFEKPEKSAE
ncbi:MAG: Asp23/Gls24 family envelope stress response protein [Ruminococcaceae bacterium]|nr:Asp23/Gls24 family envelope stress response protein [Oscillospiraceae bacterium]